MTTFLFLGNMNGKFQYKSSLWIINAFLGNLDELIVYILQHKKNFGPINFSFFLHILIIVLSLMSCASYIVYLKCWLKANET